MTPLLPAPDGPDGAREGADNTPRGRGRKGAKVPSTDQILEMLMSLNGLVALRLISTSVANVMQRSLRTILDVQMRRAREEPQAGPQEGLAQA